jgi:hypothetical protein
VQFEVIPVSLLVPEEAAAVAPAPVGNQRAARLDEGREGSTGAPGKVRAEHDFADLLRRQDRHSNLLLVRRAISWAIESMPGPE